MVFFNKKRTASKSCHVHTMKRGEPIGFKMKGTILHSIARASDGRRFVTSIGRVTYPGVSQRAQGLLQFQARCQYSLLLFAYVVLRYHERLSRTTTASIETLLSSAFRIRNTIPGQAAVRGLEIRRRSFPRPTWSLFDRLSTLLGPLCAVLTPETKTNKGI